MKLSMNMFYNLVRAQTFSLVMMVLAEDIRLKFWWYEIIIVCKIVEKCSLGLVE